MKNNLKSYYTRDKDDASYQIGDIRTTVVARWTAGEQVERSIMHQGHNS